MSKRRFVFCTVRIVELIPAALQLLLDLLADLLGRHLGLVYHRPNGCGRREMGLEMSV